MRLHQTIVGVVSGLGWILGLAAPGFATDVYLNGVQITGAKDQEIENAKVVLDKKGDVHIVAPEYKVREIGPTGAASAPKPTSPAVAGAPSAPTSVAHLTKNYYVVTESSRPGMTGYVIQVLINDKFLKALSDDIPQDVLQLNNYLNEGTNTVSFRALRPVGRGAKSTLASDAFSVVLGEGKGQEGGDLTIENVIGEFKVTALDAGEKNQSFTLRAK